jgi:hypothetical protein
VNVALNEPGLCASNRQHVQIYVSDWSDAHGRELEGIPERELEKPTGQPAQSQHRTHRMQ